MDYKNATKFFVILIFLIVIGYDGAVIAVKGFEFSVSNTLIVWAYKFPIVSFAAGFVCGHLFWRMRASPQVAKIEESIEKVD